MNTFSTTSAQKLPAGTSTDQAGDSPANALRDVAELGGRVLLATLFLTSGLGKIGGYAATAGYMSAMGVPGALLPVVIATEVLGALAIILGWKTRVTAFLLAGFTMATGVLFHSNFADQIQMVMFLKNVAITGAFLLLVANGAGALSVDRRFSRVADRSA
jgi:putative oxidoreductase